MMSGKTHLMLYFTQSSFVIDAPEDVEKLPQSLQYFYEQYCNDRYVALYELGFGEKPREFVGAFSFLYQVSETFIRALTSLPELEIAREQATVPCTDEMWRQLEASIPFAIGSEYINYDWMKQMFAQLETVYQRQIQAYEGTVQLYLAEKSQDLHAPERIFFHLVESKEEGYPFAFMATYATKDETGAIRHMPLKYALTEYQQEREKLLNLLSCLNKAAEVSNIVNEFVERGEMFHTLRLTAEEAYQLLVSMEDIQACGILCRVPNWWRKRATSVHLSITLGEKQPSLLGFDAILQTQPSLCIDGVMLSEEDIQTLLAQKEGLAFLKGKWVEVNHAKLKALLEKLEAEQSPVTLMQALQMQSEEDDDPDQGVYVYQGNWLKNLFAKLRQPENIDAIQLPSSFHATLRPYQEVGVRWLSYMKSIGFGACLADDMGLGKTIQILAFLESERKKHKQMKVLLVVPASLMGNWEKEIAKFTPEMDYVRCHGLPTRQLEEMITSLPFLTITTYGMLNRLDGLKEQMWDCVILDEAQAIKNPLTKQTKATKACNAKMKIALTGTPIENELTNLWSLFDFLNKGLLGTSMEFKEFARNVEEHPEKYGKLKSMISPFLLRRLKTDKSIISDLPEKLEVIDYVSLSKQQVVLYRRCTEDLAQKIMESEGIERRGLVLAALTKLKQICNHPDQYTGEEAYIPKESGKFEMLKELCETILEKHERVLIFTQYKEIIPYLDAFLNKVFHQKGLILHGGTPVKQRSFLVDQFNAEAYVPYMVLSLKAAGTGLNLTSANHVIHFDRWWNPAVENQATDRSFRIGQTKNVLVHKLVCKGTIEEKIDQLIESKKELAENVIGAGSMKWINDMSNEELMSLLKLDGDAI